jgi:hypothetical protein
MPRKNQKRRRKKNKIMIPPSTKVTTRCIAPGGPPMQNEIKDDDNYHARFMARSGLGQYVTIRKDEHGKTFVKVKETKECSHEHWKETEIANYLHEICIQIYNQQLASWEEATIKIHKDLAKRFGLHPEHRDFVQQVEEKITNPLDMYLVTILLNQNPNYFTVFLIANHVPPRMLMNNFGRQTMAGSTPYHKCAFITPTVENEICVHCLVKKKARTTRDDGLFICADCVFIQ